MNSCFWLILLLLGGNCCQGFNNNSWGRNRWNDSNCDNCSNRQRRDNGRNWSNSRSNSCNCDCGCSNSRSNDNNRSRDDSRSYDNERSRDDSRSYDNDRRRDNDRNDCGCQNSYTGERQGQYTSNTSNGCDCGCSRNNY